MTVFFGPCPFLRCLDTDIHAHGCCSECGAINSGNTSCRTCIQASDMSDSKHRLITIIDERDGVA